MSKSLTELPLHLCQVLEEEYVKLYGPLPVGYPTWLLHVSQLKNPPSRFIQELKQGENALQAYLKQTVNDYLQAFPEAHQEWEQFDGTLPPSVNLTQGCIDALNAQLGRSEFTKQIRSANLPILKEETRRWIHEPLAGNDLIHIHRLVLEEVFPKEIESIHEVRVAAIYTLIHPRKPAALCFSGGGIRSATFALGVIQGLARHGLLDQFEYLSTVSGGGYIGSWLTAWIHRHRHGLQGVIEELSGSPPSKLQPEPRPLYHLRSYSNYLSPKLGFLSADTWTLVGIYLRNLLLNWGVLIPLLSAVLIVPRIAIAVIRSQASDCLSYFALVFGFVMGVVALVYMGVNRPGAWEKETEESIQKEPRKLEDPFLRRLKGQGAFLIFCLTPLLLSAISLTTYWAWHVNSNPSPSGVWSFIVFGAALHLCGWILYSLILGLNDSKSRFRRFFSWNPLAEGLIILLTGGFGGALGWSVATKVFSTTPFRQQLLYGPELYVCFAVSLFLAVFLLVATLFVGLTSRVTTDEDREWWAREGAWVLIATVVWSALSSLVIFGPLLIYRIPAYVASLGGISGVISILGGHSRKTSSHGQAEKSGGWQTLWMDNALLLAAPLFLVFIISGLSLQATWLINWLSGKEWIADSSRFPWMRRFTSVFSIGASPAPVNLPSLFDSSVHKWTIHCTPLWLVCMVFVTLLAVGLIMAFFININKFSLHAMYRNRLIRAYLGASREDRSPNPFTGFDPQDNIPLWELRSSHIKPLHVINTALNLVAGKNLAWQQRKAESFTVTTLHSGSYRVGYRRSEAYGVVNKKPVSLGTAVAISGAAASPNMGYHSSPLVTFLMTLFNARLGWWMGNPSRPACKRGTPWFAVGPMMAEALGLTDDKKRYVYLSDGGHFENLGIYEMVRRRCHVIVVSDGGCDPDCAFEDLGNAIRKIRIDLGVPIEFRKKIYIHSRSQSGPGKYAAVARICYSYIDPGGKDGFLVYLKPAFYGREPADIFNYAQFSSTFPHETTADQWFSESQFESYRKLGSYIFEDICGQPLKCGQPQMLLTLSDFVVRALNYGDICK